MKKLELLREIEVLKDFLDNDGSTSKDPAWIIAVTKVRLSVISGLVRHWGKEQA